MKKSLHFLRYTVLEIVLVVLCVYFAKTAPGFLTQDNLLGVLSNISVEGVVALGMTIVIICGEIDLSVGSGAAWSACWMAWIVQTLDNHHVSMPLNIAIAGTAAIATGSLIGDRDRLAPRLV